MRIVRTVLFTMLLVIIGCGSIQALAVEGEYKNRDGYAPAYGLSVPTEKRGFYNDGLWTYYFDDLGQKLTGWQYLSNNGAGNWYYFDDHGAMAQYFEKINDQWYYFNEEGILLRDQILIIEEGVYSCSADGHLDLGWQFKNNHWYYFARDNAQAYEGMYKGIEGDSYSYLFWLEGYTDKNGNQGERGTLAIGNPYLPIYRNGILEMVADENGHLICNQEMEIDGRWYAFDENGIAREIDIFRKKVEEIKQMFPVGTYWKHYGDNNPQSYTTGGGVNNSFNNSFQCAGFAQYLYYYVYGQPFTQAQKYDPIANIPVSLVCVGDYVRLGNDEHSVFITDIYVGADGKTYWNVAREVWGSQSNKIEECNYVVIDDYKVSGSGNYTIDSIRRADNTLRKQVGLPDAGQL